MARRLVFVPGSESPNVSEFSLEFEQFSGSSIQHGIQTIKESKNAQTLKNSHFPLTTNTFILIQTALLSVGVLLVSMVLVAPLIRGHLFFH